MIKHGDKYEVLDIPASAVQRGDLICNERTDGWERVAQITAYALGMETCFYFYSGHGTVLWYSYTMDEEVTVMREVKEQTPERVVLLNPVLDEQTQQSIPAYSRGTIVSEDGDSVDVLFDDNEGTATFIKGFGAESLLARIP